MPAHVTNQCVTFSAIASEEWAVYERVFASLDAHGIAYAIGGSFAKQCYTGIGGPTKDLDIYVLPSDREAAIRAVSEAGMADYYPRHPYDRAWIYRSCYEDVIVDIIWAMANQRAQVDEAWITQGRYISARDRCFRLVPPEELLWSALYVFQRDRCDWPDGLNLVYVLAPDLKWHHLLDRVADDAPLLAALLEIFLWLCPDRAGDVPADVRETLHQLPLNGANDAGITKLRAARLDLRPWFKATLESE